MTILSQELNVSGVTWFFLWACLMMNTLLACSALQLLRLGSHWQPSIRPQRSEIQLPQASYEVEQQHQLGRSDYEPMIEAAKKQGIAILRLSQILQEEQRSKYFADACCHYSEWGVQQVSKILTDWIAEQLEL